MNAEFRKLSSQSSIQVKQRGPYVLDKSLAEEGSRSAQKPGGGATGGCLRACWAAGNKHARYWCGFSSDLSVHSICSRSLRKFGPNIHLILDLIFTLSVPDRYFWFLTLSSSV